MSATKVAPEIRVLKKVNRYVPRDTQGTRYGIYDDRDSADFAGVDTGGWEMCDAMVFAGPNTLHATLIPCSSLWTSGWWGIGHAPPVR
jgi:hypothetical protein